MIGVAIVSYNSSDVIFDCLESLLAARDAPSRIVIVDNASPDGTADLIADWARTGRRPSAGERPASAAVLGFPLDFADVPAGGDIGASGIALVRAPVNGGYAAGVNQALTTLARLADISLFWILNPDTVVPSGVADAYIAAAAKTDGMMGCRIAFCEPPHAIQSDGGVVDPWTGVCTNLNRGTASRTEVVPAQRDLDFISGANLVVPRRLLEALGPMSEDYFLYYEEVDWARRAKSLGFPLIMVQGVTVLHHGGTALGSGTLSRQQSPLSAYFNSRNRMRFIRRWTPSRLPSAYLFGLAKSAQLLARGEAGAAWASLLGIHGFAPPSAVRDRITPDARHLAFGAPGAQTPSPTRSSLQRNHDT